MGEPAVDDFGNQYLARLAPRTPELQPFDVDRLRCGQCGDDLLPDELIGHLYAEGRVIPQYEAIRDLVTKR